MKFYDAHNHLQDERFAGRQSELLAACEKVGVAKMVVNGACESDWPQMLALARENKIVLPSFGYHPWHLAERTPDWQKNLEKFLDAAPSAVGEIGLDRWKSDLSYAGQEEVFLAQLQIATERNLPVSIHCLHAWGRLLELLQNNSRPANVVLCCTVSVARRKWFPHSRSSARISVFPAIFCTNENYASAKHFAKFPPTVCSSKPTRPTNFCPPTKINFGSPMRKVNH
jgi:TatD DNase family protein